MVSMFPTKSFGRPETGTMPGLDAHDPAKPDGSSFPKKEIQDNDRLVKIKLLGAPGIATRSKNATGGLLALLLGARTLLWGSWPYY